MTFKDDNQFWFPAWGISVILHGAVVCAAFIFVGYVKPVLQDNPFQWDVALVEEGRPRPNSEHVSSVVASAPPSVEKLLPSQTKLVPKTSQSVMPVERKIEPPSPAIEQVPPVEQKVEVPQLHEEPLEQVAESAAESTVEPHEFKPVSDAPTSEAVESRPVEQESVAVASAPDLPLVQEGVIAPHTHDNRMDSASVRMADLQASGQETKADNRWLAESLWRRVAELKRYPSSSRMNGEEGKVVLRAVIRSDGQLETVSVQKSSGYSALDEAAMEAVRLACPLHMRQAIGKPQIVVTLPIVYRLAS